MRIFNLKQDWHDFINNHFVLLCKTEELARELLSYCKEQGIIWSSSTDLIDNFVWGYDNETCYRVSHSQMTYADIAFYENEYNYEVVEFNGFDEFKSKFKVGMGLRAKDNFMMIDEITQFLIKDKIYPITNLYESDEEFIISSEVAEHHYFGFYDYDEFFEIVEEMN